MPMDSNHQAVPGSLPSPKAWFHPWAIIVMPRDALSADPSSGSTVRSSTNRAGGVPRRRSIPASANARPNDE